MIEYYGNEEKRRNDEKIVGEADIYYLGNYEHLGNQYRIATMNLNRNTDIKVFRVFGSYKNKFGDEFHNVLCYGLFSSKHGIILEPTYELDFYQGERYPKTDFDRYIFPYFQEAGILVLSEDSRQTYRTYGNERKEFLIKNQIQYSEVENILNDLLEESVNGKIMPISFEEFEDRLKAQRNTLHRSR